MDLVYLVIEKYGQPRFQSINFIRESGEIHQSMIDAMFKKADRVDRSKLSTWLPPYFDDMPIGPATYMIRWLTYVECLKQKAGSDAMHKAWLKVGPKAIELVEFVMDIRKGEWTKSQIEVKMKSINVCMNEIKQAQKAGNWFAQSVVSSTILNIPVFVKRFKTLKSYISHITNNEPSL